MLYDILIIDDDFSGETVLDEMEINTKTTPPTTAWKQTVFPFYFELIRDNLKVIWSTGELDDLEKLDKHHLSKVKYIICDLHLLGIANTSSNKNIITKIKGIIDKLDSNLCKTNIKFLINSKYIDDHPAIDEELRKKLGKKYSVSVFSGKNAITHEQKLALVDMSLLSHIKEQVIKKHLEVERCLNKKITDNNIVLEELSFFSKHKIVKKTYNLNGHNKKIDRLNKLRNTIAHTQINSLNDLTNINNIDIRNIKQFSNLFAYIDTIDELITNITKASLHPRKIS